jgi:nucleoside 2-deoxyribosyltransferase
MTRGRKQSVGRRTVVILRLSLGFEMLALCVERTRIAVCETQRCEGPPVIYIAGPYSEPDPAYNTHRIVRIADRLLEAGFVPVLPHLSLAWQLISPKPYQTWLEYDRQILARCDAVLRVPGYSQGAAAETRHAIDHGIPVIHPRSAHPADCIAAVASWYQHSVAPDAK